MWNEEVRELRKIFKSLGLEERIKWNLYCYCVNDKNVVIIQPFKSYLAVLFFKGLLLKDPKNLLVKTGKNTHAGRQLLFDDLKEVRKKTTYLKSLVKEAIKLEEAGLKIPIKEKRLTLPDELQSALNKSARLKKAFDALTPGRQRAYAFFISSAKQVATREARIRKCAPMILAGKGFNE